MCDYCEQEKDLVYNGNASAYIKFDQFSGKYVIYLSEYEYSKSDMKAINVCPMCGRELRGDAE